MTLSGCEAKATKPRFSFPSSGEYGLFGVMGYSELRITSDPWFLPL